MRFLFVRVQRSRSRDDCVRARERSDYLRYAPLSLSTLAMQQCHD